ncbi:retroviral-like aspartic protease family protein [Pseudomonas sp. WJP1]|uniref:retropepsin-like aspartic protease n=1 Tax=Pseudomonas sp. WJP1 TaxID=2986947 RepID=UPI0023490C44|nr:retropepsin-like aspartic protease [Pseudomonas sp. WJP1]WCM51021.1 retroviral-like aspartic protease family protein [Pseudomonas sp. WJP1]
MKPVKRTLLVLVLVTLASFGSLAGPRPNPPERRSEPEHDFYQWVVSGQGQKASLAQMQQRCDRVLDAGEHLSCSVSVIARMFETKAANQLPDYMLATQRKHARAIDADPELKVLFSMFGSQSLSALRATGDFSVSRTQRRERLVIHPYSSDVFIADQVLPFIDVSAANGHSARFVLDTGAPQTRVNHDTAKLMGIKLLTDSHYAYSTFYGERDLSARLGILDSIKLGGSEFRNVLVFVSDRDNLFGLDLISKLGRLKIARKTLELNPAAVVRCESPIMYSRADINQRLVIAARLDNRVTQAIVDTGNVDYLTSASPGDPINAVKSLVPGNSPLITADRQHYQTFKGVLNLPGHGMAVTYKYYPGFTIPPSWVLGRYVPSILLGWQAFNDFELNLDVDTGRSCFNSV